MTCLTLGVILYIILLYYIIILHIHILLLYIIYYCILSYTLLPFLSQSIFPFLSSSHHSFPLLFYSSSSSNIPLPILPSIFHSSYLLFLSYPLLSLPSPHSHPPLPRILVGTYLCLFILQSHLQDILTPHVLSEWMVEVCGEY